MNIYPLLACGCTQPYLREDPIKVIRDIYNQLSETLDNKLFKYTLFCVCKVAGMQILKCFLSCNKFRT